MSYPKVMESSATLLQKPQYLHPPLCYPPVTFVAFHTVSPPNFLYAFPDSQSSHASQLFLSTADMGRQVSKLVA
jgi:hypothetical protein